jgi:mannose-6-phosphate isomerase
MTPVVVTTTPVERERLFDCEHFLLWRLRGESPFNIGAAEMPRVLVCIEGSGWSKAEAPLMALRRAKYGSCPRWSAHVNFTQTT